MEIRVTHQSKFSVIIMEMTCISILLKQFPVFRHHGRDTILGFGSSGDKVRQMQEQLNVIAGAYPALPKVDADGIYGTATENSVRKFQSIFNLPQTGVVDYKTWYKISEIYVGVSRIAELT